MYERFYGFSERPFSLLPDPDFLFLGEHHRTALELLELTIVNQSGFCVISGEIGAGKTTLIRELLNRLGDDVRVGLVSNTHRSFGELMQWIMAAYGLPCGSGDRLELHKRFIDFVIENYAHRQTTLLIIDEAQNLSVSALEELRMLSNVNSDKHLVLQVVLVGQGQLRDKLKQPVLEQFAQRIAIDFHLPGMTEEETCRYIRHRVRHAGAVSDLFSEAACRAVHRYSNGIPRLINRICDLALVCGYAEESPQITPALVQAVIEDQRMGKVLDGARKHPGSLHSPGLKAVTRAGSTDTHARTGADRKGMPVNKASASVAGSSRLPEYSADAAVPAPTRPDTSAGAVSADAAHDSNRSREQAHHSGAASQTAATGEDARPAPGEDTAAINRAHDKAAPQRADTPVAAQKALPANAQSQDAGPDTTADDIPKPGSELHALVVNAEQQKHRRRGTGTGLWLLSGIVAIAAAASWSTREAWYPLFADAVESVAGLRAEPKAAVAVRKTEPPPQAAATPVAVATPSMAGPEPAPANIIESQAAVQTEAEPVAAPQESEPEATAAADAEENDTRTDSAAALAEQTAAAAALAAQEAELRREQERLSRVKEEAKRLKRERLAAERKLAEQRKARQALEQQARREREQQRHTRSDQALRAPAPARERAQATASSTQAGEDTETPVRGFVLAPAQQPKEAAVAARDAQPSTAPQPPVATPEVSAPADAVAVVEPLPEEPEQADTGLAAKAASEKFLANPCNGPTARFMSTCSRP